MNAFVPLTTQLSPSSAAVVRVAPGVGAAARLGQPERAERLARGKRAAATPAAARRVPNR